MQLEDRINILLGERYDKAIEHDLLNRYLHIRKWTYLARKTGTKKFMSKNI